MKWGLTLFFHPMQTCHTLETQSTTRWKEIDKRYKPLYRTLYLNDCSVTWSTASVSFASLLPEVERVIRARKKSQNPKKSAAEARLGLFHNFCWYEHESTAPFTPVPQTCLRWTALSSDVNTPSEDTSQIWSVRLHLATFFQQCVYECVLGHSGVLLLSWRTRLPAHTHTDTPSVCCAIKRALSMLYERFFEKLIDMSKYIKHTGWFCWNRPKQ